MPQQIVVRVQDLLLDLANPRLEKPAGGQAAAISIIAQMQGPKLIELARDITKFGTDPTSMMVVVSAPGEQGRYVVKEGNRRLVALRALENPALVEGYLSTRDQKALAALAADVALRPPIDEITCLLFEPAEAEVMEHFIELRHTGANRGAGLDSWGAEEQARHRQRQGRVSPALTVIDYVRKNGSLSPAATASNREIMTNVQRLINDPAIREVLGIELVKGRLKFKWPEKYVLKPLTKVVEDLLTGAKSVPQIYHRKDRAKYARQIKRFAPLPKRDRLSAPLDVEPTGRVLPAPGGGTGRRSTVSRRPRNRVIPRTAALKITVPRVKQVYQELQGLDATSYRNACSVLLRVFLEFTVDHYYARVMRMNETRLRNDGLAKKWKAVADHMLKQGLLLSHQRDAIHRNANAQSSPWAAHVPTFNLYVHNPYTHPVPRDLLDAWDSTSWFFEAVWR